MTPLILGADDNVPQLKGVCVRLCVCASVRGGRNDLGAPRPCPGALGPHGQLQGVPSPRTENLLDRELHLMGTTGRPLRLFSQLGLT